MEMDKEIIPETPFIIILVVGLLMLLISFALSDLKKQNQINSLEKRNQINLLENKIKYQHEQIQELKHKLNKLEIKIIKWKNFRRLFSSYSENPSLDNDSNIYNNKRKLKMNSILITKDWLKENAKRFSKIYVPNYGKGYVRWVKDEQIDFMVEQDDGSFHYHIVTFDYVIEHREEITIYLEEPYNLI